MEHLMEPASIQTTKIRKILLDEYSSIHLSNLGIMFEYVASSHTVNTGNQSEKLTHSAWNIQSSFLITGEKSSFGAVVPDKPLGNGFGALEIATRYGALSIDNKTFPTFSDPNRFAEQIKAWAIGLNWYPTEGSRFSVSYEQTDFESSISAFNMKPEKVLIARLQVVY
ncbi:MAG: hypothetical protein EA359_15950 [Balneolaceae bacterium]|nr:MAG: hypothetical protein EA359_15950 [Balneolaceae bacterium]